MGKPIHPRWLAASLLLALLLGCRFPGAARPVVKIGLVAPFEGRYRAVGYDVIYAVRLAIQEANAAGGVAGYSVELVAYDDGADPAMAALQARKLDVDPQVVAVLGHFREETLAAARDVYAAAGIPLVAPGVPGPAVPGQDAAPVHWIGPGAAALADALLDRIAGYANHGELALVSDGSFLGDALEEAASCRGVEIAATVSPWSVDWLPTILDSGAGVLICSADPFVAGEVAAALQAGGWDGLFFGGPGLAASDFAAVAGEVAEGALFVTPYPFPTDVPGSEAFTVAYCSISPHVPPPGPLALPAYEAARLVLEALARDIESNGAPTREGMTAALATMEWGDGALYWYRIDAQGMPMLVGAGED